ncbi:uncharacterized protein GIQ15_00073 [Arthroderma uncinatum]|uniref:uncharacterized protein n=1 Tax=Arthroderma uncinatum TaxID=74035 RepID=UPI00144A5AB5|nr:uncharacterized protein GIQ15_00073 [Arthroderma uncinatum]KAF3490556.1 hypothetical protein GIQ15_00073 [Arthroderma uncinatum]
MSVPGASPSWDLTPAISLLHSFSLEGYHHERPSSPDQTAKGPVDRSTLAPADVAAVEGDGHHKLGDFDALFTFLSQASPPKLGAGSGTDHGRASGQIAGKQSVLESATVLEHQLELAEPHIRKILLKRDVTKKVKPHHSASATAGEGHSATVLLQPKTILRRPTTAPPVNVPAIAPTPSGKRIVGSTIHVEALLTGSMLERQHVLVSLLTEKHAKSRNYLHHGNLREYLCYPLKTAAAGIHVFVDMSNIMIGFHDCIKKSRDIPVTTRVRRLPLSFQNFSLVLERARPVSKRVLVGSDRFPAIDEAEELGYEANILERVHKARPSSPRKKTKLFSGGGRGNNGGSGVGNALHDQSSSSETNARQPAERWVEQAVDEILHLKILESIVDTDTPSTIVLATGDAAQAEYSDGFLKMVERALGKGWSVELVSFSSITSRAYTRKSFRDKWGSRFRIFELDVYAEYLLDL